MTDPESGGEKIIGNGELFRTVENLIDSWNFAAADPTQTAFLSFNVSHWLMEIYGQKDNNDVWHTWTSTDGIDGIDMPASLQPLLMYSYKNEPSVHNDSSASLRSQPIYYEHDPVIPKWDEIEDITPFTKQLEIMKNDPEIRDHIVQAKVEVEPGLCLTMRAPFFLGWGLEFEITQVNARVAPFGEPGKTWVPTEFVRANGDNQALLCETICRLTLSVVSNKPNEPNQPAAKALDVLENRLTGKEKVPYSLKGMLRKPGNSVKNLLISYLLEPE